MNWLGFFSLLAFSCTVNAADIERLRHGLLPVHHASIPLAVKTAVASVYQIFAPTGEMEIVNLAGVDASTFSSADPNDYRAVQLQLCLKQKIEKCPVAAQLLKGSAFCVRDSQTLATHVKNIRDWYQAVLRHNPGLRVEALQAPLEVRSPQGETVFSSLASSFSTLKLSYFNRTVPAFDSDYPGEYIELHFSEPSSARKPLATAKAFDSISPLYLLMLKSDREVFVATGRLRFPPDSGALHLFLSQDLAAGAPGSPLLNVNGEVVSMFTAKDTGRARFVSLDHKILELFWGQQSSAKTGGSF